MPIAAPIAAPPPPEPAPAEPNYLNTSYGIWSWLLTVDHKRIGILYLVSITVFFVVGGIAAGIVRLNLLSPTGAILNEDAYNRAFTAHGVMMLFFFLIPAVPAVLGNFFIPMMIGAKDLAFPKLNLASWYVFMIGAVFGVVVGAGRRHRHRLDALPALQHAIVAVERGARRGRGVHLRVQLDHDRAEHHGDDPQDALPRHDLGPAAAVRLGALRHEPDSVARRRRWWPSRCFCSWSSGSWGVGIFDPSLGGDPVLFQHLFWFYSHPAVYIMILPGMGVISEVITCFSRKNIFGYHAVAWSSMGIAVVGFLLWAHHMFVAGHQLLRGAPVQLPEHARGGPLGHQGVQLDRHALPRARSPSRRRCSSRSGSSCCSSIGGLTGLFLATLGTDIHLHDTYFVVAHFHFVMVGGMVHGLLRGAALLVAEDDRPDVLRLVEPGGRVDHHRRVLPDVRPAVHHRLPRHAAALSELPARVPDSTT